MLPLILNFGTKWDVKLHGTTTLIARKVSTITSEWGGRAGPRFHLDVSENYERRLLASLCLSVCPPARMEQFGYHCADFHEILFVSIFLKSFEKI